MKCSVCSTEIEHQYCPKCGQEFKGERITFLSLIKEWFNNVFSLEKSVLKNMKIGLWQPQQLTQNYWDGFRKFHYPPSKFFAIAALFVLFNFNFSKTFLGITITSTSTVAIQFIFLIFIIVLFAVSSYLLYFRHKRNFTEHLILNIYNVSIWTIIFTPLSLLLDVLQVPNKIQQPLMIVYLILIAIWNARSFMMTKRQRMIHIIMNFVLFAVIILLLIVASGGFRQ